MTKDRKTALSSLRSIATLQTHARGAKPRERHQIANRYARLENERARLEREIGMWDNCRQMAASKLAKVREEIELAPAAIGRNTCRKSRRPKRARAAPGPRVDGRARPLPRS